MAYSISSVDPFNDGSGLALYQLDGNANDTGENYNGTWSGTEQYDTGVFGQSASFDGSSYIYGSDAGFPSGSSSRTISLWVNGNDVSSGTLFSYGTDTSLNRFSIYFNNSRISIGLNGSNIVYDYVFFTGIWYFVVISLYGTTLNETNFYLNSNKITTVYSTVSATSTVNTLLNEFRIGFDVSNNGYSNGFIDQVRIFNRTLTDDEVKILYHEYKPDMFMGNIF